MMRRDARRKNARPERFLLGLSQTGNLALDCPRMSRFAAFLGILLHVLGALVAPGLHLHAHGAEGAVSASAAADACCAHAHEAPAPASSGEPALLAPGHDEANCALCEMAQWVGDGAPRSISLPTWAETGRPLETPRSASADRAVESGGGTRGPPERTS